MRELGVVFVNFCQLSPSIKLSSPHKNLKLNPGRLRMESRMRAGDRGIPGSIFSPRGHEGGCLRSDERKCHTMLSHWSEVLKENTSFSETYQVLENANRTHPFVREGLVLCLSSSNCQTVYWHWSMENGIEWFYTNTGEDFLFTFIESYILYNVFDEYWRNGRSLLLNFIVIY